jgi:hypothetical protein
MMEIKAETPKSFRFISKDFSAKSPKYLVVPSELLPEDWQRLKIYKSSIEAPSAFMDSSDAHIRIEVSQQTFSEPTQEEFHERPPLAHSLSVGQVEAAVRI